MVTVFTSCMQESGAAEPDEIRLAYTSSTFDLPVIAAYQNGYFEEEGLKVTLVLVEKGKLGESIQAGAVDGGTADASILPEISDGLSAKIGAGVRGACVEIISAEASGIHNIKDLKGKTVGAEAGGTGEAAAAVEVLEQYGVDGVIDLNWIYFSKEELLTALSESSIDALVRWQSKENQEIPEGARVIYENSAMKNNNSGEHSHGDNHHFYESFAVLSEELAVNHPETAALVLAAWIKGVNALTANGTEFQLILAEEGGYIMDAPRNDGLKHFMFVPGVNTVSKNLEAYAKIQKSEGLLPGELEVEDFIDKVFIKLLPDWG